jgi:hypothetical protein
MKVINFSLIGVINTLVDSVVFLVTRWVLSRTTAVMTVLAAVAELRHYGTAETILLIVSNIVVWTVVVTGSSRRFRISNA